MTIGVLNIDKKFERRCITFLNRPSVWETLPFYCFDEMLTANIDQKEICETEKKTFLKKALLLKCGNYQSNIENQKKN